MRTQRSWLFAIGIVMAVTGTDVLAGDGVIEVNQTRALQGGISPSDDPGFPVSLTAGSYILTGDLVVTDLGTTAIQGVAIHVTIDLNGFTIRGPVTCTGEGAEIDCTDTNAIARGINAVSQNVVVRNGFVTGFAAQGVRIGDQGLVERVVATSNRLGGIAIGDGSRAIHSEASYNGSDGFSLGTGAMVSESTARGNLFDGFSLAEGSLVVNSAASRNGFHGVDGMAGVAVRNVVVWENAARGIETEQGALISDCVVFFNSGDGISAGNGSVVHRNAIRGNGGHGLRLGVDAGYRENVLTNNSSTVTGGINLLNNACNGAATCP